MRKKNIIIRLSGILSIFLLIFLYLVLYFFPTVKSINRLKREVKDINLKIEDFKDAVGFFSFPDEREKKYFTKAEKEFKKRIPRVRGKGDITRLMTDISGYLQNIAKKDGIGNLTIKSETGAPGIKVMDNLKYRTIHLSFSGDLKSGLNFINHIPWCDFHLSVDKITLSSGDISLIISVSVKVFYFAGKFSIKPLQKGMEKEIGLEIDFDSEALLERVYYTIPARQRKTELEPEFGSLGKIK